MREDQRNYGKASGFYLNGKMLVKKSRFIFLPTVTKFWFQWHYRSSLKGNVYNQIEHTKTLFVARLSTYGEGCVSIRTYVLHQNLKQIKGKAKTLCGFKTLNLSDLM